MVPAQVQTEQRLLRKPEMSRYRSTAIPPMESTTPRTTSAFRNTLGLPSPSQISTRPSRRTARPRPNRRHFGRLSRRACAVAFAGTGARVEVVTGLIRSPNDKARRPPPTAGVGSESDVRGTQRIPTRSTGQRFGAASGPAFRSQSHPLIPNGANPLQIVSREHTQATNKHRPLCRDEPVGRKR